MIPSAKPTLHILLVYYEPAPAGQSTHVLSLVQGLPRERYRLTVVLPPNLERSMAALTQAGAEVIPLALGKLTWGAGAVAGLVRLIRQRRFDMVHVHSQEAGLLARPLARLAGARRILYTPQTIDIRRRRWHRLYTLLERGLAHLTDKIISVNAIDQARMIGWGIPAHKVVVIPNGIDLSAFTRPPDRANLRRALGLDEARPLVMQVGRLSAQKDPLAFVAGAAQVIQTQARAQFALVGQGALEQAVAGHIQALGLDQHVHLLGWRDEAARLMAAADVVSLTSRWEGAPYALLEAMAWARPVVTTAVNGCPEIVVDGETGFVTPPGDTATWAARVAELLSDSARAACMGQHGRQRVEECYSLPVMIRAIETIYQPTA